MLYYSGPSQHEERKGMWTNLLTKSSCTRELLVFLETLANSVLISDQIPLTDSQICEKFMETNVNIYDLLEVLRLLHDSYYPQGN